MLYRWKKELRDGSIMKNKTKGTLETEISRELKRLKKIEKAYEKLEMQHELRWTDFMQALLMKFMI